MKSDGPNDLEDFVYSSRHPDLAVLADQRKREDTAHR